MNWKEIHNPDDNPKEDGYYTVKTASGKTTRLAFRDGNWMTWQSIKHRENDNSFVIAWSPSEPTKRQTKEEITAAARERRQQRRAEHLKWREENGITVKLGLRSIITRRGDG
jgi:hypothetical protein